MDGLLEPCLVRVLREMRGFPLLRNSLAQQSPLVSGSGAGGRRGQHSRRGLSGAPALTSSLFSPIARRPPPALLALP
ncbi:hypothetical protein EVAR_69689_1 [Eumeta japonica]|uniref:Uncharacterized protein n=1 Tax=Eumeta variegata TaxID=151549 RepID=A0A4C1ZZH7_EUMVA|nr:hypothetical protein EVAR_69689_1 [Eumeta japonica]